MARLGWQGKLARTDFVALLRKNEADNGRRDLSFPQVLNVVVRSFAFF